MENSVPASRWRTPPTGPLKNSGVACLLLASGLARRFGENKLLAPFAGRPLVCHALETLAAAGFGARIAVTRGDGVAALARDAGFAVALNDDPAADLAHSIALGLSAVPPDAAGCLCCVADQPLLTAQSLARLLAAFAAQPERIVALGQGGRRGNPVVFPRRLLAELAALPPGQGGGAVIARHHDALTVVEAAFADELCDVDTPEELARLEDVSLKRGQGHVEF